MISDLQFYSDRSNGARPRSLDTLPDETKGGLAELVESHLASDWLAHKFPEKCPDGQGVSGTNVDGFLRAIRALIPKIPWPLWQEEQTFGSSVRKGNATDEQIFDLIEYLTPYLVRPDKGAYHNFFSHHELQFTSTDGPAMFREQVNQLLRRGGTVFTMNSANRIERIGTPAAQRVLSLLQPNSGDAQVDEAIEQAGQLLLSRKLSDRMTALGKLWGAFERLKTLDDRDKKKSVKLLLGYVTDEASRDVLEAEMTALTKIGNQFNIRHKETKTVPVQPGFIEYLYTRLGNLLITLLDESHRLEPDSPVPYMSS